MFHFLRQKNPHTTHNSSNRSDEGLTLETPAFKLFTVSIYVFNSVVNTKLLVILSHRHSTTISLETTPFIHLCIIQLIIYKMLLSFFMCQDGERVARRGYWGDIINSPYLAFGTESEEEFLFQTSNGQHVRVSELLG